MTAYQERIILPNGVARRYSKRELEAMRDRALESLKTQYEQDRRAILNEYKTALANYGHAPNRKESAT